MMSQELTPNKELPPNDNKENKKIDGESGMDRVKQLVESYFQRIRGAQSDLELKLIISEILMSALDEKDNRDRR